MNIFKQNISDFYKDDVSELVEQCLVISSNRSSHVTFSNQNGGLQLGHKEFVEAIVAQSPLDYLINQIKSLCNSEHLHPWLNVNYYGGYNTLHNHSAKQPEKYVNIVSGVYYVKVPKDSGRIIFYENGNEIPVSPVDNQLILFDNNLYHAVEPNLSEEVRISIAFNSFDINC